MLLAEGVGRSPSRRSVIAPEKLDMRRAHLGQDLRWLTRGLEKRPPGVRAGEAAEARGGQEVVVVAVQLQE